MTGYKTVSSPRAWTVKSNMVPDTESAAMAIVELRPRRNESGQLRTDDHEADEQGTWSTGRQSTTRADEQTGTDGTSDCDHLHVSPLEMTLECLLFPALDFIFIRTPGRGHRSLLLCVKSLGIHSGRNITRPSWQYCGGTTTTATTQVVSSKSPGQWQGCSKGLNRLERSRSSLLLEPR